MEASEIGERYSNAFSLKIEFSENDTTQMASSIRSKLRESLPSSMDSVAKVKLSNPGMQEAAFKIGSRDIIGLLESPNGVKLDMSEYVPYLPKDTRIYTVLDTASKIVASLPFEVKTDSEIFFAGVYEYTEGANLLSLAVFDDATHKEVYVSSQGKYYSRIDGVELSKGAYYLAVRNDKGSS